MWSKNTVCCCPHGSNMCTREAITEGSACTRLVGHDDDNLGAMKWAHVVWLKGSIVSLFLVWLEGECRSDFLEEALREQFHFLIGCITNKGDCRSSRPSGYVAISWIVCICKNPPWPYTRTCTRACKPGTQVAIHVEINMVVFALDCNINVLEAKQKHNQRLSRFFVLSESLGSEPESRMQTVKRSMNVDALCNKW